MCLGTYLLPPSRRGEGLRVRGSETSLRPWDTFLLKAYYMFGPAGLCGSALSAPGNRRRCVSGKDRFDCTDCSRWNWCVATRFPAGHCRTTDTTCSASKTSWNSTARLPDPVLRAPCAMATHRPEPALGNDSGPLHPSCRSMEQVTTACTSGSPWPCLAEVEHTVLVGRDQIRQSIPVQVGDHQV